MKKKNKIKKRICIVALCILIGSLPWIWVLYVSKILPYTQRWFLSYDSFHQKADKVVAPYPEELPSSAEDIRYFYYTGWLDTKTGISFTVSDEDYLELKKECIAFYTARKENNHVEYVFEGNVTSDFLVEEGLEYLKEVFHDTAEDYTILAYRGNDEGGEHCVLEGVFYNDETNEVVMFGFTDKLRKRKQ